MVRIDPTILSTSNKEKFFSWADEQGVPVQDVINDRRFRVHNGRIAGNKLVRGEDGEVLFYNKVAVKVPFILPHTVPLPEWDEPKIGITE